MANYKLNQLGSQIQNDLNLLDSNTATQGQVLTASGDGGSSWQNPSETVYTAGEGININDKVVSINNSVVATKTELEGKQNTISDLETIRGGAALGSTSLQSIPIASAYVLGGVKIGSGLSIDLEGVLSSTGGSSEPAEYLKKAEINGNTLTIINKDNSTTVYTPDLSSKQDKILPEQTISLVAGENITINNGVVSATDTKYSDATTSTSGLMSSADKVKLDSLSGDPIIELLDSQIQSLEAENNWYISFTTQQKESILNSSGITIKNSTKEWNFKLIRYRSYNGNTWFVNTLASCYPELAEPEPAIIWNRFLVIFGSSTDGLIQFNEGQVYDTTMMDQLLNNKQNKLTAGSGISIDSNNIISATSSSPFPECPTTTVGDFILKANVPSIGNVNYSWLSYSVYNGEVE